MSNYTKTTDFAAKDGLASGSAGKIIRGAEFETEFDNIATAITTKADLASPSFSGTINITSASINDGSVTISGFLDEDNMATNSPSHVPTQQSVKAYVDTQTSGIVTDTGSQTLTDKTLTSPVINTSVSGTAVLDEDNMFSDSDTKLATQQSIKAYVDTSVSGIVTDSGNQTLTNKTLTSPVINTSVSGTAVLDEDDMSSDSATQLATQQSIKAYVDSQVTTQDLDFQGDSGGALSIDLGSETMTFTGGTGIDTSGSGNAVTFAIDSTVATLTGTQTLTNKTLTSPDINGGTIDNAVIGGSTAAAGTFTNLTASGTLSFPDNSISGDDIDGGTISNFASTGIDDNATGARLTVNNDGIAIGNTATNPTPVNGTTAVHATASAGSEFIAGTNDTVVSSGAFVGGYIFRNVDSNGSPPHYAGMWSETINNSGGMAIYFAAGNTKYESGNADLTIASNGTIAMGSSLLGQFLSTGTYDTSPINVTTADVSGTSYNIAKYGGSGSETEVGELKWKSYGATAGATLLCQGGNTVIELRGQSGGTSIGAVINGTITAPDLPTSDPSVAGQLWNDSGTLKVSAG